MTYSIEVLGPDRRAIAGALTHVYFSFGYMMTSAIAYALPDWHGFTLCYAIIAIATLATGFFFPESPSFLYGVGKYEEARKNLKVFAKKTKTDLGEEFFQRFEEGLKNNTISEEPEVENGKTSSIIDLFRYRSMGMVAINIGICFLVNTLVYYGLSFNVDSLAGSLYVNNVINGLVELIAYILCMVLMDKLGSIRKFSMKK